MYGDIHNATGTVCKAKIEANCPYSSDEGHAADVNEYVEYHVAHSGVDGEAIHSMIAAGTPPRDAIDVAKNGDFQHKPASKKVKRRSLFSRVKTVRAPSTPEEVEEAALKLAEDYASKKAEKASMFFGEDRSDLNDVERFERVHLAELKLWNRKKLAFIHGVEPLNVYPNGAGETEVISKDGTVFVYGDDFKLSYVVEAEEEARDIAQTESTTSSFDSLMLAGEYEDNYDDHSLPELKRMNRSFRRRLAHIHRVPNHWVVVNAIGQIEAYQGNKVNIYDENFNDVDWHSTGSGGVGYWAQAEDILHEDIYDRSEGRLRRGIDRLERAKDEHVAKLDAEVITDQERKLQYDRFRRARIAGYEDSVATLRSRFRSTIWDTELRAVRGDLT